MVDFETSKKYNQIVATIMANVLSERKIAGKIVLWDFQPDNPADRLYFNVASIVSDMEKEKIYLQMPFIDYLKMKWQFRKIRKNLRWCNPLIARELPEESKTSLYLIMDYIKEYYEEPSFDIFKQIQNEFYRWPDDNTL